LAKFFKLVASGRAQPPTGGVQGKSVVWEVTSTPNDPTIATRIVTMRAGMQEKMMLTLILSIVFTSNDLVQSRNVTVLAGGK
jgi:hypothetical protein